MEAVRDFLPFRDADQAKSQSVDSGVAAALAVLQRVGPTAVADAASWSFQAAADFAGQVEEASRAMEYLQLVAADAVERTRKDAAAAARTGTAAPGWTTGWRDTPSSGETGSTGTPVTAAAVAAAVADDASATNRSPQIRGTSETNGTFEGNAPEISGTSGTNGTFEGNVAETNDRPEPDGTSDGSAGVDDGYRNTADFLRDRLRISGAEARRRLALARDVLPRTGFGGLQQPPVRAELGAAVAAAEIGSRAAGGVRLFV